MPTTRIRVVTPRRLADRPTWLLSRAAARSHGLVRDAFEREGLRGYHFRLLAALDQDGPASQADLGRRTGIDRSDVVATLDDLVARSYARRDPDPVDRRRNVVTLTDDGRAALEHLDGVVTDVQQQVLAPLTAAERATLLRLLRKLAPES
jgi:DNA-binding MarR family transcriptional regulator